MTPRKFKVQLDVHQDIQRRLNGSGPSEESKQGASSGFIDQIPNW